MDSASGVQSTATTATAVISGPGFKIKRQGENSAKGTKKTLIIMIFFNTFGLDSAVSTIRLTVCVYMYFEPISYNSSVNNSIKRGPSPPPPRAPHKLYDYLQEVVE